MLFKELTFNVSSMLSWDGEKLWAEQQSHFFRLGREQVTASRLLDEIAHSLRLHYEADFSYRYIKQGVKAIEYYMSPENSPLSRLSTPRQRRKVDDLRDEILSILRALGALKEELGPGKKHRRREDVILRRKIDVRIHELAKRVEELRYAWERLGEIPWVNFGVVYGSVSPWGYVTA
jgi:hypothetical protein